MKNPLTATLLNLLPFGFGYLYMEQHGIFFRTLLAGIAMPFIGVLIGPVIIDGLLPVLANCGLTFTEACPRPMWAAISLFGGWCLPSALLAIFTGLGVRKRAIAYNLNLSHHE